MDALYSANHLFKFGTKNSSLQM